VWFCEADVEIGIPGARVVVPAGDPWNFSENALSRYTIEKNDDLIGGVTFDTLSVALRSGSIHRQKCLSSGIYNISTVG